MSRDFLDTMTMSDADRAALALSPPTDQSHQQQAHLNDGAAAIAVDDTAQNITELEDMGAVARDLIDRIQRLRRQIRPPGGARLNLIASAISTPMQVTEALVGQIYPAVAGGAEETIQEGGTENNEDVDVDGTQEGVPEQRPAVDGMD